MFSSHPLLSIIPRRTLHWNACLTLPLAFFFLYCMECWTNKKQHAKKMSVAERRMLRWMSGRTLRVRVRNENVGRVVGVASIEEKMRENR